MNFATLTQAYKRMATPVKAAMWYTISNVILHGISFITLPIFSRILTTEEYGQISVYSSWVSIFTIFCTLTIWGGVFNVAMVKNPENADSVISSFQGMTLTITAVFFIITMFCMKWAQQWLKMSSVLIICMYLEIISKIPFNLWLGYQKYQYKFRTQIAITISVAIINPILGYIAVMNSQHKAEARVATGVAINLVIGIFFLLLNQVKGKQFFNLDYWKMGFLFNVVLVPHYLSLQVLNQSDRLMINNICGESEAGIYSAAYTFAMLLTLFTSAINSSYTPWAYSRIKGDKFKDVRKMSNVVIGFFAIISIALICVVPEIFKFMLPEAYHEAMWVMPPVTMGAFFMFLYPMFGSIEFYYGANRYVSYASVVGALVNVGLNYIFIPIYGYIAAAYTTLACYIMFSVAHYIFMRIVSKKKGIKEKVYDLKSIICISLCVLGVGMVITLLYSNTLFRWIVIFFILCILFCLRKILINGLSAIFVKK